VHGLEGTHVCGVHLEMTGQNVMEECVWGGLMLPQTCDSSLNASQALELTFIVGDRLHKRRLLGPRGSVVEEISSLGSLSGGKTSHVKPSRPVVLVVHVWKRSFQLPCQGGCLKES
jgi:hypothetical protein